MMVSGELLSSAFGIWCSGPLSCPGHCVPLVGRSSTWGLFSPAQHQTPCCLLSLAAFEGLYGHRVFSLCSGLFLAAPTHRLRSVAPLKEGTASAFLTCPWIGPHVSGHKQLVGDRGPVYPTQRLVSSQVKATASQPCLVLHRVPP